MNTAIGSCCHRNFGLREHQSVHNRHLLREKSSNAKVQNKVVDLNQSDWNVVLRRRKISETLLSTSYTKHDIQRTWSGSEITLGATQKRRNPSCRKGCEKDRLNFLPSEPLVSKELPQNQTSRSKWESVTSGFRCNENNHALKVRKLLASSAGERLILSDFSDRFQELTGRYKPLPKLDILAKPKHQLKRNGVLRNGIDHDKTKGELNSIWLGNVLPKRRLLSKTRSESHCAMSSESKCSEIARCGVPGGKAVNEYLSGLQLAVPSQDRRHMTMPQEKQEAGAKTCPVNTSNNLQIIQDKANSQSIGIEETVSKRVSKVIVVDGVNYMVSMEPPGTPSSGRNFRLSASPSSVKKGSVESVEGSSPNCVMNGRDAYSIHNEEEKPSSRVPPQNIKQWYDERNDNALRIELNKCSGCDVIDPETHQSLDHAALRLRKVVRSLNNGNSIPQDVLRQNLEYAISVMEMNYLKSNRELNQQRKVVDDEIPTNLSPVPPEIKSWLVQTFSKAKIGTATKRTERRSLRSVAQAVRGTVVIERLLQRKSLNDRNNAIPPQVQQHLKRLDDWNFDVFELEAMSNGNSLKYVFYQLLDKYGLMGKFKISLPTLQSYCHKLQKGYRKHNNRYHNPIHAADVAQTLNCLLVGTGFVNWLSELEMFSMILAAVIHDVEHTGTTNNFHINTRSHLAKLYNDKSVLENHHISTAFRMLEEEDSDILRNFSKEDYQECRALVIDMVLATDMSQHFGQISRAKSFLPQPQNFEKSKAMCMMIHATDINHPTKPWKLHYKWTERLVVEFFEQGDRERDLKLSISPLCDRNSTMVAQSQIGFIDYVIKPTFGVVFDIFAAINGPLVRQAIGNMEKQSKNDPNNSPGSIIDDVLKRRFIDVTSFKPSFEEQIEILKKLNLFKESCFSHIDQNRQHWMKKDEIEKENLLFGDQAFREAAATPNDTQQSKLLNSSLSNESDVKNQTLYNANGPVEETLNHVDAQEKF